MNWCCIANLEASNLSWTGGTGTGTGTGIGTGIGTRAVIGTGGIAMLFEIIEASLIFCV